MKVFGYIRVSTVRTTPAREDGNLVKVIVGEGRSAKTLDRPGLMDAVERARGRHTASPGPGTVVDHPQHLRPIQPGAV